MGKTTTEMQLVPLSKLVPYVNNARTHSPEQLTKLRSSLREFGFGVLRDSIQKNCKMIAGGKGLFKGSFFIFRQFMNFFIYKMQHSNKIPQYT